MARILIVEDDETLRSVLASELKRQGHDVAEARDGTAGSVHLARGIFEVIVTDMYMPGKDGFELMAEIRRQYPATKIIVMSGGGKNPSMNISKTAKFLGADSVLAKPFKLSELRAAISSVLPQ